MKRNFKILSLIFLSVFIFKIQADAQQYRKYYQKSGKLVQKMTGAASGTQTVYWDDYGNKELTITDMSMMGMSQKQTALVLGKDMYTWNDAEPTVYHIDNSIVDEYEKRNFTAEDFEKLSSEMMQQSGFEKKGTETIAGKECTLWENPDGIKLWGWKNLTLQIDMNVMGMSIKYETVSLDLDTDIPADVFQLPEGKTVEDQVMTEEQQQKQQQTIEIMNNMTKSGDSN